MRITEALAAALEGTDVRAFDVAPGVVDTDMTRSMAMWQGNTDWTPPEQVVELVAAIAAGELDHGRVASCAPARTTWTLVRGLTPDDAARQLRLRPYGDDDPLA